MASPEQKVDEPLRFTGQSRRKVLAAFQGISQSDSQRQPTPDKWWKVPFDFLLHTFAMPRVGPG